MWYSIVTTFVAYNELFYALNVNKCMNVQCVTLRRGKFVNFPDGCMTVHRYIGFDVILHQCQESGSRVVFGKNKHNNPPPAIKNVNCII